MQESKWRNGDDRFQAHTTDAEAKVCKESQYNEQKFTIRPVVNEQGRNVVENAAQTANVMQKAEQAGGHREKNRARGGKGEERERERSFLNEGISGPTFRYSACQASRIPQCHPHGAAASKGFSSGASLLSLFKLDNLQEPKDFPAHQLPASELGNGRLQSADEQQKRADLSFQGGGLRKREIMPEHAESSLLPLSSSSLKPTYAKKLLPSPLVQKQGSKLRAQHPLMPFVWTNCPITLQYRKVL